MPLAVAIIIIVGVLMQVPAYIYLFQNPRREGEPIDKRRRLYAVLMIVGGACWVSGLFMLNQR